MASQRQHKWLPNDSIENSNMLNFRPVKQHVKSTAAVPHNRELMTEPTPRPHRPGSLTQTDSLLPALWNENPQILAKPIPSASTRDQGICPPAQRSVVNGDLRHVWHLATGAGCLLRLGGLHEQQDSRSSKLVAWAIIKDHSWCNTSSRSPGNAQTAGHATTVKCHKIPHCRPTPRR